MTIFALFRAPFVQARDKLRPLRLRQHEVADGEFADVAILKSAAKIFNSAVVRGRDGARPSFNPAFADLDRARRSFLPARSRSVR